MRNWGWQKNTCASCSLSSGKMRSLWKFSMSSWWCWRKSVAKWNTKLKKRSRRPNNLTICLNPLTLNKIWKCSTSNWRMQRSKSLVRKPNWNNKYPSRTPTSSNSSQSSLNCKAKSRSETPSTEWMNSKLKSCAGNCLRDYSNPLINNTDSSFSCHPRSQNLASLPHLNPNRIKTKPPPTNWYRVKSPRMRYKHCTSPFAPQVRSNRCLSRKMRSRCSR